MTAAFEESPGVLNNIQQIFGVGDLDSDGKWTHIDLKRFIRRVDLGGTELDIAAFKSEAEVIHGHIDILAASTVISTVDEFLSSQ